MSNMKETGYTVLYKPPIPHAHDLPVPDGDLRGWVVMCNACGGVFKCSAGDYGWYWRPLSIWSERRWKKRNGIHV